MPSALDLANIVLAPIVAATFAYVVYKTLAIRRTMAAGVYRRQALGLGLVAVAFVAIYLTNFLPISGVIGFLSGVLFYAVSLVLLYWVDSSILAVRLSDPLVRDTMRWSQLRRVVWVVAVADAAFMISVFAYYNLIAVTSNIPDFFVAWAPVLFPLAIDLAALCAVTVLPVAARRSKDLTLRRSLEWFVVFIAIELALQGVLGSFFFIDVTTSTFIGGVALLLGAFPLHQSAKKLITIYRFSDEVRP